jgi:hypothetical protein
VSSPVGKLLLKGFIFAGHLDIGGMNQINIGKLNSLQ